MGEGVVDIREGDCREVLKTLPDNSVDAVVTDPPYGLNREPDIAEVLKAWLAGEAYRMSGGGFMGKEWDAFVPGPDVWREVFRVMKPGAHLLAFAGTRTYDLMTIAIRLAGFEVRDQVDWIYGSGFPKSLDVSKALDKRAGAERASLGPNPNNRPNCAGSQSQSLAAPHTCQDITAPATPDAQAWSGWGTALKPAHEPICVARKPLIGTVAENVLAWGCGGINVEAGRIGTRDERMLNRGSTTGAGMGYGGAVAQSVIDGGAGRWPANVLLDDEAAAMLDEQSGESASNPCRDKRGAPQRSYPGDTTVRSPRQDVWQGPNDSGGASRFFYTAKSSRSEREGGLRGGVKCVVCGGLDTESHTTPDGSAPCRRNAHPTVKPVVLMRYLVRLVCRKGGVVLDPFLGSGTTAVACRLEGMGCIGIDMSPEYVEIARRRVAAAEMLEAETRPERKRLKAKGVRRKAETGAAPALFAEAAGE